MTIRFQNNQPIGFTDSLYIRPTTQLFHIYATGLFLTALAVCRDWPLSSYEYSNNPDSGNSSWTVSIWVNMSWWALGELMELVNGGHLTQKFIGVVLKAMERALRSSSFNCPTYNRYTHTHSANAFTQRATTIQRNKWAHKESL